MRLWRLRHHVKAGPPPRGAVQLDVERVCRARGIVVDRGPHSGRANLAMLGRLTGLSYVTLYNLLRRPGRHQSVSLDTLARLCEGLCCQPGELLVYTPVARLEAPRESYCYGAQATHLRPADLERDGAEFRAAHAGAYGRSVEHNWPPEDDLEQAS